MTALGLAAARTVETGRPDRLIEDRLARHLYREADADLPMLLDWPAPGAPVSPAQALHLHGSRYIGLRTRFYDDFVTAAVEGGVRQAVLLGAGLDTRAYRLALPGDLRLFELDQPGVLAWKRSRLQGWAEPACPLADVGIDLRQDWPGALRAAGFDPALPAVFIAEGLLAYLGGEDQREFLGRIGGLASPGTRLALDRIVGDPHSGGRVESLSERSGMDMTRLMAPGDGAGLAEALGSQGWEIDEAPVTDVARRYGRDLSDPFAGPGASQSGEPPWLDTVFMTAWLPVS